MHFQAPSDCFFRISTSFPRSVVGLPFGFFGHGVDGFQGEGGAVEKEHGFIVALSVLTRA